MTTATTTTDFLMVGGGTGGHVFPAIAIAEAIESLQPQAHVAFAGMRDGFEARALAAKHWPFFHLSAAPLKGKKWQAKCRAVWTLGRGVVSAYRLLGAMRPRCVIGTGGYVSAPVLVAARCRGIPAVIQEQNSVPGLTNRLLGKFAHAVCATYPESAKYFSPRKVVQTGLPLRHAIVTACTGRTVLAVDSPLALLVMGGSQGARRLNELVCAMAAHLPADRWRMIHIVGKFGDVAATEKMYASYGLTAEVYPFVEQMDQLYPRVHVAISRSGASSVAELTLAGIPTVFVPFPFATDNHQQRNAESVARRGGAVVLPEATTTPEQLAAAITAFVETPAHYAQLQQRMRSASQADAAEQVVAVCERVMQGNR